MEFGLFIQNFVPNSRREHDPDAEHHAIFEDIEAVIAADKAGFKYVWLTEHHFLDEYSHLSANDVVAGTSRRRPNASTSVPASSTRCHRSTTRPRSPSGSTTSTS